MASRRFVSVRELLQGAALEVAKTTGSTAALTPIWNDAVGPSIAKNAHPVALYGADLVVHVTNQQWADALKAKEKDVLQRLDPAMGVKRLRVEVQR